MVEDAFDPETALLLQSFFAEEARDHLEAASAALMGLEASGEGGQLLLLEEVP